MNDPAFPPRRDESLGRFTPGHSRVIVARLDGSTATARLLALVMMRLRTFLARSRPNLPNGSGIPIALYPSIESPSVAYQLTGAAKHYAERNLLPSSTSVPKSVTRFLGLVAGCSPSVAAVALVSEDSMIARIPSIIATILPLRTIPASLSAAEIYTTHRVYLVFGRSVDHPEWVVHFGRREELRKLEAALAALHVLLPDLVPDSIAFRHWQADTWMHVQRGLPGLPWFRLSTTVGGVREWLALRARAAQALSRFQAAVAANSHWVREVALGQELEGLLAWYCGTEAPNPVVMTRAEYAVRALSDNGTVRCQWQHGDYCFNNMLVSPDRLGLIDFEEFGQTSMPLHDEFSLAFSTHEFLQNYPGAPALSDLLRDCLVAGRRAWGFDAASLEGLLLHHLLWRLRQCEARPKRLAMGAVLRHQLIQLVSDVSLRSTI